MAIRTYCEAKHASINQRASNPVRTVLDHHLPTQENHDIKTAYDYITFWYGDRRAKRSNVPLIWHIDEGLFLLDKMRSAKDAKAAFCVHPCLQANNDFESILSGFNDDFYSCVTHRQLILAVEYRNLANRFLCKRDMKYPNADYQHLLPSIAQPELLDMLRADKIQNRFDFELNHEGHHPRSEHLANYFKTWLYHLGISEQEYEELSQELLAFRQKRLDIKDPPS